MAEEKVAVKETGNTKAAKCAFVTSLVGFGICFGWLAGGIAGLILSIISLVEHHRAGKIVENKYRKLNIAALPIAIVGLISSITVIVVWSLYIAGYIAASKVA